MHAAARRKKSPLHKLSGLHLLLRLPPLAIAVTAAAAVAA